LKKKKGEEENSCTCHSRLAEKAQRCAGEEKKRARPFCQEDEEKGQEGEVIGGDGPLPKKKKRAYSGDRAGKKRAQPARRRKKGTLRGGVIACLCLEKLIVSKKKRKNRGERSDAGGRGKMNSHDALGKKGVNKEKGKDRTLRREEMSQRSKENHLNLGGRYNREGKKNFANLFLKRREKGKHTQREKKKS